MPATFAAALAIGLVACVTDLRTRRIPNVLTLGSALMAVGYHLVTGGGAGVAMSVLGWVAGVAFFFLPFALGGLGGGDVKLMGALGAWLGAATTVWVAIYAGIAGGLIALVVAAYRGYLRAALRNLWLLLVHWRVAGVTPLEGLTLEGSSGPRLAYAVPIFVGILVTTWLHS